MDPMRLSAGQRLDIAKLSGTVQRLTFGIDEHLPLEEKLAALHAITRDPRLLGWVLGAAIVNAEQENPLWEGCLPLLRAAGADEQAAQEEAADQRARRARLGGGPRT